MKTLGIVFLAFGILGILTVVLSLGRDTQTETLTSALGTSIFFGVIGAFAISKANKKRAESNQKKEWEEETKK